MLLGYIRTSIIGGDGDGETAEDQRTALRAEGVREADIIVEFALGGDRRPMLDRCVAARQEGDVIVTSRLDRIGRSIHDLIDTVRALRDRGAHLRCLDGTIDTSTPDGTVAVELLATLARYDSALGREQERARMTAERRRLVRRVFEPKLKQADRIFAALDHGATPQAICRAFDLTSYQLRLILKQRAAAD